VTSAGDLEVILSQITQEHADALFLHTEFVINKYKSEILDFTSKNRLPCAVQDRSFVEQGSLLYYNTDLLAIRRRAAIYVDKVLRGVKPGHLPIEQPSRFEFIINLKTASALGLTVPVWIVALADKVIE
jgi:putative ABC transport system substrate-binding protein